MIFCSFCLTYLMDTNAKIAREIYIYFFCKFELSSKERCLYNLSIVTNVWPIWPILPGPSLLFLPHQRSRSAPRWELHYTTLHYTTLHYTTLHYTTLHYTTLHYTTLHYTTLHYNQSINQTLFTQATTT